MSPSENAENVVTASSGEASKTVPPWIRRAVFYFFTAVIALFVLQWLVQSLESLLILVLVSLFLSFAIEPAVNRFERMGIRRGAGTGVMFVVILAAIGGFGFAMGAVLADQITELVADAPDRIDSLEKWLQDNIDEDVDLTELRDQFLEGGSAAERLSSFAGDLLGFGTTIVNLLFDIFTIALFTFYLVADGPKLRRTVCSVLPPARQRAVLEVWHLGVEKTGGYILSRSILGIAAALVHWIAFRLLGVPFELPLALWMGVVSQFIPVVGTYLAGALPILIALLDRPITGLWVLIVVVAYQMIENYTFAPRVTAQTMEIHPAVAFGAVIAGAAMLGPVGALLALPASATLQAFGSTYISRYQVDEAADLPLSGTAGDAGF